MCILPLQQYPLQQNKKIKKYRFQIAQSYMCTYPLLQLNHEHKRSFPKFPVLYVYLPRTTSQKKRYL